MLLQHVLLVSVVGQGDNSDKSGMYQILSDAQSVSWQCTKATQAVIHAAVEHAVEHGEEIAEDDDVVEVEDVDSEIEAVAVDSGSEAVAADPDSETVVTVDSNSETVRIQE